MIDEREKYCSASKAIFKFLVENNLAEKFCEAMKARAEHSAREQTRCNDSAMLFRLSGEISICNELHDGAAEALEEMRASANATPTARSLTFTTMEV